jgi:hypothetical protein
MDTTSGLFCADKRRGSPVYRHLPNQRGRAGLTKVT